MSLSKRWDKQEQPKIAGKLSTRVEHLLGRGYIYGYLKKPLEQLSDEELCSVPWLGPCALYDIRQVLPRPRLGVSTGDG